jgi:glutaminase
VRKLEALTNTELSAWVQQAKSQASKGRVANRIRRLAEADSSWFAVYISCKTGVTYSLGDTACVFPLMSTIKPFLLLYLLEHIGAGAVFQWVGVEPSNMTFNSLEQLIADLGRPRNPMINSGAITLADKLPGSSANHRTQQLCQWLNQLAGCSLKLDEAMLASVREAGSHANRAIAKYLTSSGYLENLEIAIDTYEQICCLSGTVEDLARLGLLLAYESRFITPQHRYTVNTLMLTCGLYEASSHYTQRMGLPMKSGISGALLAIVPEQGAIACYSPPLDSVGNPVAALSFVEALSQG